MTTSTQPFWRRSILWRAATQVVVIALFAGLIFVSLTLYLTERYTQEGVSQRLEELLTTVQSTAEIACFTKDSTLAAEVAKGLATNSEVFAIVISGGTDVLAERHKGSGHPNVDGAANAGRIVRPIASPFNPKDIVGEIVIDPDPNVISVRVREYGGFVALLLGLQLLVVVSAVLAVVLLLIVRPIKKMSDRLHVMDADSAEPLAIPQGQERTEIGRLAQDINQLGRSLLASRDEEHLLRMQREFGERKYRAIFENADSGIFVIDQRMRPESCNLAFYRQLNLLEYSLNAREIRLAELPWRNPGDVIAFVRQCLALNTPGSADFEYVLNSEEIRWFNLALTPIGEQLLQGLLSDISRHKEAEHSAQQEAITDVLSGLLNRNGFLQRLDEIILECKGNAEAGFSLMLLDLDGFKRINESLGLASGDQILTITANRLRACLKNNDVIARLGGDNFGIILRASPAENFVAKIGARIVQVLKNFFDVGTTPIKLGASLGITLFPNDGEDPQNLLRNAELALDHARRGGGSRFSFFDISMARNAEHRSQLENELRLTVRRDELLIYFQPIIDLSSRRLTGAEALLRWKHPQRGVMPPDAFIPLAEETGTIVDIGLWILDAACQQLAAWQATHPERTLSINISARQIPDGLPPISLIETVNRYGVDPANLAIEITESVFLEDFSGAQNWLNAVHELGFKIYLDDFGTGYSSLSYLKRFPVDVIKIDKSFVRDMSDDNSDRALVIAIINMANSLGLKVIAEGVESLHQMNLLKKAGCHCVQGYYFSKPVSAQDFELAEVRIQSMLA